ncbi:MAG: glycerol-3-phosphate dehydrogenase [Roseovarius sp.]|nr:glycerol-3-phosphate dehydrogenase [Roseovarius sp.]
MQNRIYDLFVIGGGVNGCGIARDAAGRGASVCLAEMGDIGGATSASSTKLIHGGLRYLEYFEFRLVRHSLVEREILLAAMPHISWPMRFVLPLHAEMRFESATPISRLLGRLMPWLGNRRPSWIIRLGLFLYDNMGKRKILPGTRGICLDGSEEGLVLKSRFDKAYEYSDCWIEDNRLVVLNARDAENLGGRIMVRTKVLSLRRTDEYWEVAVEDLASGKTFPIRAKVVVNAAGPWAGKLFASCSGMLQRENVRLVRGSHIVTRKLYDHDKCYLLQGADARVVFMIPFESDFTLVGTTDVEHGSPDDNPECSSEERRYLIDFVNNYLENPLADGDVVWTYSGVRPLYDDGNGSATAATRDYVIVEDISGGAPLINVFGGKITTFRCLAEDVLKKVSRHLPEIGDSWTKDAALPGGDFPINGIQDIIDGLRSEYPFLTDFWARRLARAYGTEARHVLGLAKSKADLGRDFGASLTERELRWLVQREFARTAEDVLWRRTKLGLRLDAGQIEDVENWIKLNLLKME